ncbi:hypothetical protein BVC80_9097g208 [Macleaya cordata]|uniref:Uncharacterized protein n=1 Tax=Macleaya cordata TaxID=56857 RepID=A0A200QF87_MACCD|nr:hypothetical protein BVC80_9097g208 [Macleaya cordata]
MRIHFGRFSSPKPIVRLLSPRDLNHILEFRLLQTSRHLPPSTSERDVNPPKSAYVVALLKKNGAPLKLGAAKRFCRLCQGRLFIEREQTTAEQLHLSIQKQKKTEEELNRKLQELQTELALSHELQHKLERKVEYLQNDNVLLENKQKELKATIGCLLQSRDSFLSLYEDSTCEMKRSIEIRDRKLSILSEKMHTHMLLFDSIEKEAVSVKQVVGDVQRLVSEKGDVVAGLKRKLDQVSAFEKEFVEKIWSLENKLRCNKEEIRRKDTIISELEGKLEAAKISNNCQPQIEEISIQLIYYLQKSLSVKEDIIQNLTTEKKGLHFEVRGLEIILLKIQEAVMNMNAEDQKVFSSVLKGQEECPTMSEKENNRSNDMVQESREESPCRDSGQEAAENTGFLLTS